MGAEDGFHAWHPGLSSGAAPLRAGAGDRLPAGERRDRLPRMRGAERPQRPPATKLCLFRAERLVIHEVLVRVMADLSIPMVRSMRISASTSAASWRRSCRTTSCSRRGRDSPRVADDPRRGGCAASRGDRRTLPATRRADAVPPSTLVAGAPVLRAPCLPADLTARLRRSPGRRPPPSRRAGGRTRQPSGGGARGPAPRRGEPRRPPGLPSPRRRPPAAARGDPRLQRLREPPPRAADGACHRRRDRA